MLGARRSQPRGALHRGRWRARDGAALIGAVDGLRELGLSAAGALEEMAALLQEMAIVQAVPGALVDDDPDSEVARRLASLLPPTRRSSSTAWSWRGGPRSRWRPTSTADS